MLPPWPEALPPTWLVMAMARKSSCGEPPVTHQATYVSGLPWSPSLLSALSVSPSDLGQGALMVDRSVVPDPTWGQSQGQWVEERKEARGLVRKAEGPASLPSPSPLPAHPSSPLTENPQLHDVRIHLGTYLSWRASAPATECSQMIPEMGDIRLAGASWPLNHLHI